MTEEYTQSYIDTFRERHGIFRRWVLGSAISIVPICLLNLVNEIVWESLFISFLCQTGMVGMMIVVILLLIGYFVYDIRSVSIDSYIRNREWDERLRLDLRRHRDRLQDEHHRNFTEEWSSDTPEPKREHFDEDLFTL